MARERPRTAGAKTNRSTGLRCRQAGRTVGGTIGAVLVVVALTGADAGTPSTPAERWSWPLPVDPPAITGTFMESRQGGFHAGLDLRTAGRTGLPVTSPVDGWVRRVRTSPRGYGKALYVQTEDGRTLVFAHLSRFHAPVQERLREAMARTGRYEQDLAVERGAIPVQRGELIALSGDTGTGAPHLHLEVRDERERPLNPARWLAFPDTVAPRVRAVRLVPVDAAAQTAWPTASIVLEPVAERRVELRGRFVVQVDVRDATGFSPFGVAPYAVTLRVDGRQVYALEQSTFAFDHSRDIHLEMEREDDRRWLRLQRRAGSRVPGRRGGQDPGAARGEHADPAVVEVDERPRELEIEVADLAANRRVVRFFLDPATRAPAAPAPRLTVDEALVLVGTAGLTAPKLLLGGRELDAPGEGPVRVLDLAGLRSGRLQLVDRADTVATQWLAVAGRAFGPLRIPRTRVSLADPAGTAAHAGGALLVEVLENVDGEVLAGLAGTRPLTVPLRLRRVAWAVREGLELRAPLDPGIEHAVWMQRSGNEWEALDTDIETSGGSRLAHARVSDAGELVLVEDESDPVIGIPARAERILTDRSTLGPHGLPRPRWPELRIAVSDRGAGIGDRSPDLTLDGQPYPAVWDPEREELILDWFVDPQPGIHRFDVRAVDRSGRASRQQFEVELRLSR